MKAKADAAEEQKNDNNEKKKSHILSNSSVPGVVASLGVSFISVSGVMSLISLTARVCCGSSYRTPIGDRCLKIVDTLQKDSCNISALIVGR